MPLPATNRVRIIALVLLFGALSLSGFKAKGHRTLTEAAVSLYQRCHEGLGLDPLAVQVGRRLASGSKSEDRPTPTRWRHWHFYDRRHPDGEVLGRRGSSKRLHHFHTRFASLEASVRPHDEGKAGKDLGRLLHYIQDVTLPAHVVPVLHGPVLFGFDKDLLDPWPIRLDALSPAVTCQGMADAMAPTFRALLDSTAAATYRDLDHLIPGTDVPWRRFWIDPPPKERWGTYDKPPFGERVEADDGSVVLEKDDPRYDAFVLNAHRRAVEASAAAIAMWMSPRQP